MIRTAATGRGKGTEATRGTTRSAASRTKCGIGGSEKKEKQKINGVK